MSDQPENMFRAPNLHLSKDLPAWNSLSEQYFITPCPSQELAPGTTHRGLWQELTTVAEESPQGATLFGRTAQPCVKPAQNEAFTHKGG